MTPILTNQELFQRIQTEYPLINEYARPILESTALTIFVTTLIKNAPYTYGEGFNFVEEITTRVRFAESSLCALASTVHNLVAALFFTVATIFTVGKIEDVVRQAKSHWIQLGVAQLSFVFSLLGVVSGNIATNGSLVLASSLQDIAHQLFSEEARNKQGLDYLAKIVSQSATGFLTSIGGEEPCETIKDLNKKVTSVQNWNELRKEVSAYIALPKSGYFS